MFSDMITTAKPESPVTCFDQYLSFHDEIMNEDQSILQEIHYNSNSSKKKGHEFRLNTVTKLKTFSPIASTEKKTGGSVITEEKKKQTSSLISSIKLAKEVQIETGNWFMEFLEAAVESGMKKKGERNKSVKWPQSLILKVINWVESEQSDSTKRMVHPKAAHVARKLRIKAKNP